MTLRKHLVVTFLFWTTLMASLEQNPLLGLAIWIGFVAVSGAVLARDWYRLAWVRRHFWLQMSGWMFAGYVAGLIGHVPAMDEVYMAAGFAAGKCVHWTWFALCRTGLPARWRKVIARGWDLLVGNV